MIVETISSLDDSLADTTDLLDLAVGENDEATVEELKTDLLSQEKQVVKLEFRRMFSGEMDSKSAYLDIQSGSGGTEAQDWANMLLRQYLRWGERRGFKTEVTEISNGDVAGINCDA